MKWMLGILLVCSNVMGFNILSNNQKLPLDCTYSCPDKLLPYVDFALQTWNNAADHIFIFTRVDSNGTLDIQYGETFGLAGWTEKSKITIGQNVFIPWGVVLHEIGHALGLDHSLDPNSVMQANVEGQYIDQDDVDGIRFIYDLSPKIFTFQVIVKGHRVKIAGTKLVQRYPKGTYTIRHIENGIEMFKQITIK